jgi:hypothetical protein
MRKISRFFTKTNILLLVILFLGIFLRLYKAKAFLSFGHDNDLEGWIIKDIVVNKHFRLIGQETSTQGVFIGALYYYLLLPFYLLTRMEPTGGIFLSAILGGLTIWSVFFVFKKIFGKKEIGLLGAFVYSVSFLTVMNDRGNAPTMPMLLWSVWYLYGLGQILAGRTLRGLLLLGFLVGVSWHINVSLVLLAVLIPVTLLIIRWKFKVKELLLGTGAFLLTSLPFFAFELRHGFQQMKAVILSFTIYQGSTLSVGEQFGRVIDIVFQILTKIVWNPPQTYYFLFPLVLALALIILTVKKKISKKIAGVLTLWFLVPTVFFSFYTKVVSEYYLNSVLIPGLTVFCLSLYFLIVSKRYRIIGFLFLAIFTLLNLSKLFTYQDNKQGYIYRKALVSEIKRDVERNHYPCIAVSYIADRGYDLGYRYLFYLEELNLNKISTKVPIYTIVFPLGKDTVKEDKRFGALGLIYPDYKRYSLEELGEDCSPENLNLVEPMFLYPQ